LREAGQQDPKRKEEPLDGPPPYTIQEIVDAVAAFAYEWQGREAAKSRRAQPGGKFIAGGQRSQIEEACQRLLAAKRAGNLEAAAVAAYDLGRLGPPTDAHRWLLDEEEKTAWRARKKSAPRKAEEEKRRRAICAIVEERREMRMLKVVPVYKVLMNELRKRHITVGRNTLMADVAALRGEGKLPGRPTPAEPRKTSYPNTEGP
jgi:hypothetical protein